MKTVRPLRTRLIAIAAGLVVLIGLASAAWSLLSGNKKIVICTLAAPGSDTTFVIYTDSYQELRQPLYYEVHVNGQTRVPMTWFGGAPFDDTVNADYFTVISAEDGRLLAIKIAHRPSWVRIIYDRTSGDTWSSGSNRGSHESAKQLGQALLKRLNADPTIAPLYLGD